ncbi:hypothetical protein ACLMJK_002316 [Lecanora helva]
MYGHQSSTRGRERGRSSNIRAPSEELSQSGVFFPRASSVSSTSTTRRPRGFQPTEVGKSARAQTDANNAQTNAPNPDPKVLRQALYSNVLEHSEDDRNDCTAPLVVDRTPKRIDAIKAAQPESVHAGKNSLGRRSPSESSVSVVVENTPVKSCWARAYPPEAPSLSQSPTAKPTWDNSENPIDIPMRERNMISSSSSHKDLVNADLFSLPPHKSHFRTPVSNVGSKSRQITSSSSFRRQMSNIKQSAPSEKLSQDQKADNRDTADKETNVASPTSEIPAVDGPQEKPSPSKLAPHLRAPASPVASKTNTNDVERKSHSSNVTLHNISASDKSGPNQTTAQQTIAAIQNYEYLRKSQVQGRSMQQVARSKIDMDEELAAGYHSAEIEKDAEIAAAVAAEPNEDHHQVAATPQGPHGTPSVPPHLRKSYPASTIHSNKSKANLEPTRSEIDITPDNPLANRTRESKSNNKHAESPSGSQEGDFSSGIPTASKGKGKEKEWTSGIDTNNSPLELAGWDGQFAPAPLGEDWANRTQFMNKDEEKLAVVRAWTEDHATELQVDPVVHETHSMSPIDAQHPETLPNPDEFNQAKRHVSANHQIEAYEAKRSASNNGSPGSEDQLTKEQRRDKRRQNKELMKNIEIAHNPHAPAANIYLRPAELKDMEQVVLLHNYYILNSASANELTENDVYYWRRRYQECHDEGDPFLVAIHKSQKAAKDSRRKKSENVVGFAFASDYGLSSTAYRFTVELEVWVHHSHVNQGIGRSMLDRMLGAMDPGYNLLYCAPFIGKCDMTRWSGGGHRTIKTILMNLLHNTDDTKGVQWIENWLIEKDFKHQGTLQEFGFKFSKP